MKKCVPIFSPKPLRQVKSQGLGNISRQISAYIIIYDD